ncbi:hypothetical protein [Paracoccus sphaerophysae]|uniref:hypothetical protein n=1 Tax=Paracoccus sphaerophysae TaxID=690417 RepID=UPI00068F4ED6|nr:hypothetical protein [Paracoccus sphaerophysae]
MGHRHALAILQHRLDPGDRASLSAARRSDLPVRIARGEGFLGDPIRGRRETLSVRTADGAPDYIVVFARNTVLPFLMAVVTSLGFLLPVFKLWTASMVALAIVAVMSMRWAWVPGEREDRGPLDAGRGVALLAAAEVADPPGWWGTLFLLLAADAVLFGSLLFGYAFLWTVAPDWPPRAYLEPTLAGPALAGLGAALAVAGPRLAERGLRGGGSPWPGLVATGFGLLAWIGASLVVIDGVGAPDSHAYDATVWVIAGSLSSRRFGELRILRLWADYAALAGLVRLAAAWLPRVFA